ncbi:MAG: exo-alpha-sialidase, partial [Chloroflexi bacterium]|nr:exo-alpha-sialidase [Chloroflexota bacterium]
VFALDSLEPLTHIVSLLTTAGGELLVSAPHEGRVLENVRFARYVARSNVVVWSAGSDERLAWQDGVSFEWLSPDGSVGMTALDQRWLAIDSATMEPLGFTERFEVRAYDSKRDRYYALDGSVLTALSPNGGRAAEALPPFASALEAPIVATAVSSSFGEDGTLFALAGRGVYRSRDGGSSWERLRGGLPSNPCAGQPTLVLAVSPSLPADGIAYVGGKGPSGEGLGVWRSVDAGDTWEPVWNGLSHLTVMRLAISPGFATDGTLAAYCEYADLAGGEWGQSVFLSRDRGENWTLVAASRDTYSDPLPETAELFGAALPAASVGPGPGYAGVGHGQGDAYRETLRFAEGASYVTLVESDAYQEDRTVYVLSSYHLYRSRDDGSTWERAEGLWGWGQERGARMTALARAQDAAGDTLLIVGDDAGDLAVLPVAELGWTQP